MTEEQRQWTEAALEAVLFTMGQSVETKVLAKAVDIEEAEVREILHHMIERYEASDRGIKLIELEDSFQMCTKSEYYETLIKVAAEPKRHVLSDVVLETLAIIAYKQPITRAEIEKIRGVSSDHAVNKLVEYNLVCEVGRLNAPGRPILFATTEEFLRKFGVGKLEELPSLDLAKVEEIKAEVEEEVSLSGIGEETVK